MKIKHCLRCNSTKLEKGVIYNYGTRHYLEPIAVHWKVAPHLRADSAPIAAIICKSCGHIELLIQEYANIDPRQYQCPHCKAIYYYHLDWDDDPYSLICQNCDKSFQIETSSKIEDIFDEIEEDLEE